MKNEELILTITNIALGFANAILERNMGIEISSNTHVAEAGKPEPGDTWDSHVFSINPENNKENLSIMQVDNNQQNLQRGRDKCFNRQWERKKNF